MIHKARAADLEKILQLYRQVAAQMNKEGLFNWNDNYPDRETIEKDILQQQLYLYKEDEIQGVVVLTSDQPVEYTMLPWKALSERSAVIRRLAILPEYQRKGIASMLMDRMEAEAIQKKRSSIRLDVYTESIKAINFYIKRGYEERGQFMFAGQELSFLALEKKLLANDQV